MMLKKEIKQLGPVEACAPGPGRLRGLKCIRPSGNKSAAGSDNDRQHSSID